jgi:hypothetical protein
MKKEPRDLWLNAAQKKAMGKRLAVAIRQAKTNANRLSKEIGCTRQTIGYACRDGTVSLELLTEIVRRTGGSLDAVVLGRLPAADPEFLDLLGQLQSRAASLTPK